MRVRFTRSARRHRIGKGRALAVMASQAPTVTTNQLGEAEFSWVGEDDRGLTLEVVAVQVADVRAEQQLLLVIHVMPAHYRKRSRT